MLFELQHSSNSAITFGYFLTLSSACYYAKKMLAKYSHVESIDIHNQISDEIITISR